MCGCARSLAVDVRVGQALIEFDATLNGALMHARALGLVALAQLQTDEQQRCDDRCGRDYLAQEVDRFERQGAGIVS